MHAVRTLLVTTLVFEDAKLQRLRASWQAQDGHAGGRLQEAAHRRHVWEGTTSPAKLKELNMSATAL